ncbi:TetR/AcrR family transcriptional regulator [Actinomadura barringtoniae]|uniref:TetR/AcrR family transcriptional regulator n=1 Tax=Actinomadura barringtoniae TaxID=1427535 RepID=A0A939PF68_9ACTN|nr:TetR/AcrR family transcriptional regulator [Actinomadura barringtoniae]MBO2451097.1 TetR/AcrR family transcriptional regulator [Actinomadura barringtoniae]
MGFQRARSEEQRAERRRAILDTAAAMLAEMPVAEISLNELSRRVGLAKSNVLRYFESREAVLLELLSAQWQAWTSELTGALPAAVDKDADPYERGTRLATTIAGSLADRPVLCDLIAAQAAVLERNISTEAVAQYKRTAIADVTALAETFLGHIPELGAEDAFKFTGGLLIMTGSLWAHSQPSPALLAAYESDPDLAAFRLDFTATLQEVLEVFLTGLLARASRASRAS